MSPGYVCITDKDGISMLLSFFGLAITGMTLKFSYTEWAQWVSRRLGGFEGAGLIHRICAVAMFGVVLAHLWDAFNRYRRGSQGLITFLFGRSCRFQK